MPSKQNLRTILRSRGYRRLLAARLTSQFGDGLFAGALAGSVLFNPDRQTEPLAIASGFAVLLLPYSVLGPFVGVFLDRWRRRHVLVYTNLLRALLGIPATVLLLGGGHLGLLALLALLVIGINRFILSGHSAAMPHVVDVPQLITANALSPTLGTVCNSVALALAALVQLTALPGSSGYAALACCAGVGYLVSALVAKTSFRPNDLGPDEAQRPAAGIVAELLIVARGLVTGLRHLAHRPASASLLVAQSAYRVLYGMLTVAALLLYRNYFGTGDVGSVAGLAQVVVAGGLGSFVGATITPPLARRMTGRGWVTLVLSSTGVLVVALSAPFVEQLMVAAVFVINIASQSTKIVLDTTLQRECADDFRGRVFSVNDTAFNVNFVAGLFIGALVLPPDGHSLPALLAAGCGYLIVGLGYGLVSGLLIRRHGPRIAREDRGALSGL